MGSSAISREVDIYEHIYVVDDGYGFRDIFYFDGRLRGDAVSYLPFPCKRWYASQLIYLKPIYYPSVHGIRRQNKCLSAEGAVCRDQFSGFGVFVQPRSQHGFVPDPQRRLGGIFSSKLDSRDIHSCSIVI